MHRRVWFRRHYSKEQLNAGVMVCRGCHTGIHKRYDEMTLGKQLNTLERLLADPGLMQHFTWVSKQRERS